MMALVLFFYFAGGMITYLVSFVVLLEDDHRLTVGRILLWPIYVIKFALVGLFRAAKELAA